MSRDKRFAYIVDSNDTRAGTIIRALNQLGITHKHAKFIDIGVEGEDLITTEITHSPNHNDDEATTTLDDELCRADLLFIHLVTLDEKGQQIPGVGNEYSMEFLLQHKTSLSNTCVIAYSGGGGEPPKDFISLDEIPWRRFFPRVIDAAVWNLHAFFQDWKDAPANSPPPLDALVGCHIRIPSLKILIAAYQYAHSAENDASANSRLQSDITRTSTWKVLFDGSCEYDQLVKELEKAPDSDLLSLARSIAAEVKGANAIFSDELKEKLLKCACWGAKL